jgi:CRISPR-associated protein Cas2
VKDSKWWILCYDVRDPARLRKCARLVEGYGVRIQYSVFRCWMSKRVMARLRWELSELLTEEDSFFTIPLCSNCHGGIQELGCKNTPEWQKEPERFEIV